MFKIFERTTLGGSTPALVEGAHALGPAPSDERFEVTARIRRKAPLASDLSIESGDSLKSRRYLTRKQYAACRRRQYRHGRKVRPPSRPALNRRQRRQSLAVRRRGARNSFRDIAVGHHRRLPGHSWLGPQYRLGMPHSARLLHALGG
jgi:hypothetical protein